MDNPETQSTMDTPDTGRRQTKQNIKTQHRKLKKMGNTEVIPGMREE